MLSHELRTPLTPVLMTLRRCAVSPNLTDDLRHDLEVLQRNVELEALLIDDLLDLTRIAHGKLELHCDAVNIHSTIDHALSIFGGDLSGKKIRVTRHFEAREHHCWADPARLQQVFWNLVKNAAKFTPEGGHLDLSTRNNDAHQIVIEITDNGIGIDPELLPKIFDAFEQGGQHRHEQVRRTRAWTRGFEARGRSPSGHHHRAERRSRARRHVCRDAERDGNLVARRARFSFWKANRRWPDTLRILFVEDHKDTARVLGRILENAGFDVSHADSLARRVSWRRAPLRPCHQRRRFAGRERARFDARPARDAGFDRHRVERLRNGRRRGGEQCRWVRRTFDQAGGLGTAQERDRAFDAREEASRAERRVICSADWQVC